LGRIYLVDGYLDKNFLLVVLKNLLMMWLKVVSDFAG
jgi:hypothetical protein